MPEKPTHFRWIIVAMLFLSTTIVYFDRVILGILAPRLESEMGWSEQEYGYIVFAFQMTYAIGTLLMGYLIDRLGTRLGFLLAVFIWGLASLSHIVAKSWIGFAISRMGLGIGQAANFPASIKTIAEWFPKKERAFATGLFNGGSNMGQILAPLIIPIILLIFLSWKFVFIFSGILSVIWLALWFLLYKTPDTSRFVNRAELNYIREEPEGINHMKIKWNRMILYRQTWVVALGKLFADPVWYFYLFWGAKFLHTKFGININQLALPLMIIYFVAYAGGIAGGGMSSWLIKKGRTANFARKITMLTSAIFVLPVMTVPFIDSLNICVIFIALAAAAHNSWSANIFTVASDLFPKQMVGSVIGFSTMISSAGAMVTSLLIGYALDEAGLQGYIFPFVIAAFGYFAGLFIIHRLSPGMTPVKLSIT